MKILCKAFAKVQFSTVSLYGTMRKGKKEKRERLFAAKAFAKVQFSYSISLGYYEKRGGKKKRDCLPLRHSPGFTFLKVSLYGTLM